MRHVAALSMIGLLILFIIPSGIILRYSHEQVAKTEGKKRTGRGNVYFNFLLPPKTWNMEYDRDKNTGKIVVSPMILKKEHIDDMTYYRSSDGETCWDAPLPCAPTILEDVQLRNPSQGIAGGFIRTSRLSGLVSHNPEDSSNKETIDE